VAKERKAGRENGFLVEMAQVGKATGGYDQRGEPGHAGPKDYIECT
jgi:hypothetical protein